MRRPPSTPSPINPVLVLSGGALKAVSGLGVAQCFRERGLSFDRFLGCSGGAIVASFLATGLPPREAGRVVRERARSVLFRSGKPPWAGLRLSLRSGWGCGLLDPAILGELLARQLGTDAFDALPGALAVNAIHLRTGTEVLFTGDASPFGREGAFRACRRQGVGAAVSASAALPLLFRPALLEACDGCPERSCGIPPDPREDGGMHFIDGGFLTHLPLKAAAAPGTHLAVAVAVSIEGPASRDPVREWAALDTAYKAADIVLRRQVAAALESSRRTGPRVVCLEPPLRDSPLLDPSPEALERSFDAGHLAAERLFESLGIGGRATWEELSSRLRRRVTTVAPEELREPGGGDRHGDEN